MECCPIRSPIAYRKIPKISPGAYIFQRPCLRGSFLKGPIFGGAYVRGEICVSKACNDKEIYHFSFVLLCIRGRGGLHSEGRFNRGFFALRFCGGSFSEFYGIFKPREDAYLSVFFLCDKQHESRRVREKKPKFKKSSSLVLIGQTIYSHSKTRKFILKQCRQCVQQSIHLLINFQVFK